MKRKKKKGKIINLCFSFYNNISDVCFWIAFGQSYDCIILPFTGTHLIRYN